MVDSLLRYNYAQLMFYVREKYWSHAEELCTATIQSTDDWLFRVWRAMCYDQQGLVNEALREYKAAEQRRDTAVPAIMGVQLIYKHNKDHEGVATAEMKLSAEKYADLVDGWVQAAALCWAAGDVNAAHDILLRYPESQLAEHRDEYTNLATMRGWVDLSTGRGAFLEKCGAAFQRALDLEANVGTGLDINAAMGRAAYLERKYQFPAAQELLNRVIVAFPNFTPALVVKARLLMRAEDWEQSTEATKRILVKEKNNIEAIALEALHALVKDTRYSAASVYLNKLLTAVKEREPKNAPLLFQFAQAFSRLSGENLQLLGITIQYAELAHQLDSRNGEYECEIGYQQMYRGDLKTALSTFEKAATRTDSLGPLLGTIACHIKLGKVTEAGKQLHFCNELQSAKQRNAELSLLNAQVQWLAHKDQAKTIMLLDQAAETLRQEVHSQAGNGLELYVKLNQPLMLTIAREYMQHCRNEPPDPSLRSPDAIAERCRKHLELLTRHVPGCMEGQLMLAKIHFVSGDLNQAQAIIRHCLQQEQPLPEAYLLSAQVLQYLGNVSLANQALEQALTLDFELKDQPFYNLLLGVVLGMQGKVPAALESLQRAMSILANPDKVTSRGHPLKPLSVPDHVTLYLQLAQAHLRLHDVDEARNVLSEAMKVFRNTTQSGRVAIAQAMLLARTDVDRAIATLREVPKTSDFFIAARTQMAKLYLTQRHNPIKYTECFEEMVKEAPSAQSYVELGEAYGTIQEPEKAITAYEKARALAPHNSELAVRIGRALVSTHDYEKAVRYYEDALSSDASLFNVRASLAVLHWHLGDAGLAVSTLEEAPGYKSGSAPPSEDTVKAIERVNCALLLYKVHRDTAGHEAAAMECLLRAREFQLQLLSSHLRSESRETVTQQKGILATICTELAQCYMRSASANSGSDGRSSGGVALTQAREFLDEAIKYNEIDERALLALARLHQRIGDTDACEQQCSDILKMNPECEEAVVLLAELAHQRGHPEDAGTYFQQLLSARPDNYDVLVRCVRLLCRAGKLAEAEEAIEKSATGSASAGQRPDPGLSYARGLWCWFSSMKADALRAFNLARLPSDNPWATRALVRMIEIYLVPTTQDVWVDTWQVDEKTDNMRSAEQLLLQLPIGEVRQMLEAHCMLASKQPAQVEAAMHVFLSVIGGGQSSRAAGKTAASATATTSGGRSIGNHRDDGGNDDGIDSGKPVVREARADMDEDDLLLEGVQEAVSGGNRSPSKAAGGATTTLAAALQSKTVHMGAFNGLAISLYLSNQETAARNVLARMFAAHATAQQEKQQPRCHSGTAATTANGGETYDDDDTTALQRAMMLSAHMDIKANQFDAAQATLQKLLESDKSCGTAWDSLGMLYERQQKHKDASECYQHAWTLVKEGDPAVGYKLAFNYLKGGDLVKAIDVSKKVLSQHAAYPRIEADVMDVAYSMLRP